MSVELWCRNCLAVCRGGQRCKRREGARLMRCAVVRTVGGRPSVLIQRELERTGYTADDEGGASCRRTVADGHPALRQGPTQKQRHEHQDRSQMSHCASRCAGCNHSRMLKSCNAPCPEMLASQSVAVFRPFVAGLPNGVLQFASVAAARGEGVRVSPRAASLSATPGLKFIA